MSLMNSNAENATTVDSSAVEDFIKKAAPPKKTIKKRGRPPKSVKKQQKPNQEPEESSNEQKEQQIELRPVYKLPDLTDTFVKLNMRLDGISEVDVTIEERASYLKALLFGKPWQTEIILPGGLKYVIRALTEAEFDEIKQSTEKFAESAKLPADIIMWYQKCAAVKQLISAPGIAMPEKKEGTIDELVKKIISPLPVPVWNAAFTAIRIFEIKRLTCQNNILNDSFWTPAGSN